MTAPIESIKQRRKRVILHELSEPITTESLFIAVAALCAAGENTYEKRQAMFREAYERQMSAFLNDEADELLERIEASPSVSVAANRKNRRREVGEDIQRIISVAKKLGL
jgi:hypothetical protein